MAGEVGRRSRCLPSTAPGRPSPTARCGWAATSPGGSSRALAPAVLEVDGWRLGLAICRDTGVPRHAADTAALGMDAYVAGVLESAEDAAVPEERARRVAAEHHVWVAIASFAGSTGGGYSSAAGGSGIWTPEGIAAARAGAETGAVARATLGDPTS